MIVPIRLLGDPVLRTRATEDCWGKSSPTDEPCYRQTEKRVELCACFLAALRSFLYCRPKFDKTGLNESECDLLSRSEANLGAGMK